MSLDVYFKQDIYNSVKSSVLLVIKVSVANGASNVEYIRGILDLAHAQCIDYGINWRQLVSELRPECGTRTLELLESSLKLLESS